MHLLAFNVKLEVLLSHFVFSVHSSDHDYSRYQSSSKSSFKCQTHENSTSPRPKQVSVVGTKI